MKSQQKPTVIPKSKGGRPKAQIDWDKVDKLLIAGCEGVGIADIIGVSPKTLYHAVEERSKVSFCLYRQQKVANGNELIRTKQFSLAMEGDKTMLVWLGKQRLGQSEKVQTEVSGRDGAKIPLQVSIADVMEVLAKTTE